MPLLSEALPLESARGVAHQGGHRDGEQERRQKAPMRDAALLRPRLGHSSRLAQPERPVCVNRPDAFGKLCRCAKSP
eukprot:1117224-Pyramimonas_sp.AAC.1